MGPDAVTEMAREHLGAKTNAKEGRVFLERDPDPVYLAAQPGVFVVGAHWTAEHDHADVACERLRQRIAVTGAPAIKFTALRAQEPPEPTGS